jgi:WD40 repeat protein
LAVGLASTILLLNADFRVRRTLPAPSAPHDLQFNPDGRMLAAGSWFRLTVGRHQRRASLDSDRAQRPDNLARFKPGRSPYRWAVEPIPPSACSTPPTSGWCAAYQAHDLCGTVVRFSPDGHTLATASDDESVRLYRLGETRYSSEGAIPSAH